MELTEFDKLVHNCTECKELPFGYAIKYYPIISFGNPVNKPLLVIGLNPSDHEYVGNYVSNSNLIEERHRSQINYFMKKPYTFFKNLMKFFDNPVKNKLGWARSPWEKVGYLDIVKCPTRKNLRAGNQWSYFSETEKEKILMNCSPYLALQLRSLSPKLLMAYGKDVCRWFYPNYEEKTDAFLVRKCKVLTVFEGNVVLVPQTRGSHSAEKIQKVKKTIIENI